MTSHPRRRSRVRVMLLVSLGVVLFGTAALPMAGAAFVTTTTGAVSVTAAGYFPTYPEAVLADAPLFYHRFDEPAGAVTAADSSGNNRRGVYSPRVYGGPQELWALDEGSGSVSRDLSGAVSPNDLTIGSSSWVTGQAGTALSFNGTSDYAASAVTGVDTSIDFSVSAWVYLSDASTSRTAVSQSGATVSGFELGYDQPLNAWIFRVPQSDGAAAVVDTTYGGTVALNTWTYLSGTVTSNSVSLYVDGVRVGVQPVRPTPWNATGVVQVGAALSTTRTRFWSGRVDDVRIYPSSIGVNSTSDVASELAYGITGGPSTSWQFDENTGTTVVDSAGVTNTATLLNGATWTNSRPYGASAGSFDGVDDTAVGRFSAVDTSGGFSVNASVYLTVNDVARVAVSQDGTAASGFALGYDKTANRWTFEMARSDVGSPVVDQALSTSAPTLNTWVQLTGVYNPTVPGAELTLYVNRAAVGTAAHTASWSATGTAVAGAAFTGGTRARYWKGRLDDIRTFRRALSATDVSRLSTDPTSTVNSANPNLGRATLGVPGALQGTQQGQQASTAMAVSSARNSYNPYVVTNPTQFTVECWYRATSASSSRALINFSSATAGNSSAGGTRRLYVDNAGNVGYGQSSGSTISSSGTNYTNGAWHYFAAVSSPSSGIFLYADGRQVASRAYNAPSNGSGYWRWNGDTWGGVWSSDYNFTSTIDEVAVYPTALSAQQISWHYWANH